MMKGIEVGKRVIGALHELLVSIAIYEGTRMTTVDYKSPSFSGEPLKIHHFEGDRSKIMFPV